MAVCKHILIKTSNKPLNPFPRWSCVSFGLLLSWAAEDSWQQAADGSKIIACYIFKNIQRCDRTCCNITYYRIFWEKVRCGSGNKNTSCLPLKNLIISTDQLLSAFGGNRGCRFWGRRPSAQSNIGIVSCTAESWTERGAGEFLATVSVQIWALKCGH